MTTKERADRLIVVVPTDGVDKFSIRCEHCDIEIHGFAGTVRVDSLVDLADTHRRDHVECGATYKLSVVGILIGDPTALRCVQVGLHDIHSCAVPGGGMITWPNP